MYESGQLQTRAAYEWRPYETGVQFELPHSCDEWKIGNLENAKLLHKELGELIKQHS